MKSIIRLFLITVFSLGLTNCSATFFTLNPDEDSTLEMGRRIIEKENELAYSTISFEEQVDDNFILHVFAYNKKQEDFIFNPAEIYIKYYDENKNPIYDDRFYVIDPEEQIDRLNSSIKEREDTHDVVTGLNIVFSLFDTIVDLTDDEDNDAEEVLENVVIFTGNQVNEEMSYDNDIDYLKANKLHWKNEVLRKTELSKDEGVEGIIYVPLNPEAEYIKVYLPLGKTQHTYKFKQIGH